MASDRVNVERTLIALQAVALCCLALAGVLRIFDYLRTGTGIGVAIMWLVLVPLIGLVWVLRPKWVRAGHGVALTVAAVALATPVAVFGSLGFTIPVLLLIVAFAVTDVAPRAGIHSTFWISGVGFVLIVSDGLGSPSEFANAVLLGLVNVVPVAVLLCFGLVLGLAQRGFERLRIADQRVIARLKHASEIEKELLLSDERARSARELHDGLGHHLTLVTMSLELAERMREIDADQAWEEIHTARLTSSSALSEMRMWVRALSPVRESGARGLAALELIADSFRGTGLNVAVNGDSTSDRELTVNDGTALLIYRAVQEGLTNALRHGRAHAVDIELRTREHHLELVIVNDLARGASAEMSHDDPELGFGLRGLNDRATERGGTLSARWQGNHFVLTIVVPLGHADANLTESMS